MRDEIIAGMANVLWWMVWADVQDASPVGQNLAGAQIDQLAPPAPQEAVSLATKWVSEIETKYGHSIETILLCAAHADKCRPSPTYCERFGECLAYCVSGAGVSWEDDHEPFNVYGMVFDCPFLDCGESHSELEHLVAEYREGMHDSD